MEETEGYLTFELGTDPVHAVFTFEEENRNMNVPIPFYMLC